MAKAIDPLEQPRKFWQGYGWFLGKNLLVTASDINAMNNMHLAQAQMVRPFNPGLADIMDQMAAEFYAAALDELAKRGRKVGTDA